MGSFYYLGKERGTARDLLSTEMLFAVSMAMGVTMAMVILGWRRKKKKTVYLVDYICFKAPDQWRLSISTFLEHARLLGKEERTVRFLGRILENSGYGPRTSFPPSLHYIPMRTNYHAARIEAHTVYFSLLDRLFSDDACLVKPSQIDILVLNSCIFYPVPSLSAMIVNRYKMKSNVKTFNLSGMGCAASTIAVDLARCLLEVHVDSYALVLSVENMSSEVPYQGKERSLLLPGCIFRLGGAAILLSNHHSDRKRSKYVLRHTLRTHTGGTNEKSYGCILQIDDDSGHRSVVLSKDLISVAADCLTRNIVSLAPLVLPLSEKLRYVISVINRAIQRKQGAKLYTPDFKKAFDHFCIHAGGKAVIEEVQKSLSLTPALTEASFMSLHRFGNTSSSSVWYELSYLEAKSVIKKGHTIWQVGIGSGFKCGSIVWVALKNIHMSPDNPWYDCISDYPVQSSEEN